MNAFPKQVYVFVHSKEASFEFNKKVHLDHFHYRIGPYYLDSNKDERDYDDKDLNFYLRTYENDRLILDYRLKGNQAQWVKVTFPRSKVPIDKIVVSRGVELDNISLHY